MTTVLQQAPEPNDPKPQRHPWLPTRKWFVQVVGMIGSLLIMYFTTGSWDQEESVAAVTLAVTALSTYLIPNDPANTNSP